MRVAPLLAVTLAVGCGRPAAAPGPSPAALAAAESLYLDTRDLRDRIDVLDASGADTAPDGTARALLARRYDSLRPRLATRLAGVDSTTLQADDARALGVMRRTLSRDLGEAPAPEAPSSVTAPDCGYDPAKVSGGADSLRARIYACYGWTQAHLLVDGDTVDRLTLLGSLGRSEDPERRRREFLALAPVWRSMNGENDARSPYRRLIALEAARSRGRLTCPEGTARCCDCPGVDSDDQGTYGRTYAGASGPARSPH